MGHTKVSQQKENKSDKTLQRLSWILWASVDDNSDDSGGSGDSAEWHINFVSKWKRKHCKIWLMHSLTHTTTTYTFG